MNFRYDIAEVSRTRSQVKEYFTKKPEAFKGRGWYHAHNEDTMLVVESTAGNELFDVYIWHGRSPKQALQDIMNLPKSKV